MRGLQNQLEHHLIMTKYEAVPFWKLFLIRDAYDFDQSSLVCIISNIFA